MKVELSKNRSFDAKLGDFVVFGDIDRDKFQLVFMIALDSNEKYILIDTENGKSLAGGGKSIDSLLSKYSDDLKKIIPNEKMLLKEID